MSRVDHEIRRRTVDALLRGPWHPILMAHRIAETFDWESRAIAHLAAVVHQRFPQRPRAPTLWRHLAGEPHFTTLLAELREFTLPAAIGFLPDTAFAPPAWLAHAELPRVRSAADLAAWAELPLWELRWLSRAADRRPSRWHYHYRWVAKVGGQRLIEAPKPRLKALQRQILRGMLDRLPLHDAAVGFRRGGSVLEHALRHTRSAVVIRMDLADFFTHISGRRVAGFWREVGYSEPVTRLLTGLCTDATPGVVLAGQPADRGDPARGFAQRRRLAGPHLPQGAPTSPALANAIAYRLDCRLRGLARQRGLVYSRYADDLVFSHGGGSPELAVGRFVGMVERIAVDEGFGVRPEKTRVMRAGTRQQVTGLVVNRRVNTPRDEFDRLKAILHNCRRDGPAAHARGHADFRAHLLGRISWIAQANPRRGERLRALHAAVDW